LGPEGWRTEARLGKDGRTSKWIIATSQANDLVDSVPQVREDPLPDEPPDNALF
jgi:hypothetical protein